MKSDMHTEHNSLNNLELVLTSFVGNDLQFLVTKKMTCLFWYDCGFNQIPEPSNRRVHVLRVDDHLLLIECQSEEKNIFCFSFHSVVSSL